jgi:hypothetical protein
MIPNDPFYWQEAVKVRKGDTQHLSDDAYHVYQYLQGLGQYTLSAALIAAYRDYSSEWLEAFSKQFFDSFINPDSEASKLNFDPDLLAEIRHYRALVQGLSLPVKIEQLTLF